MPPDTAESDPSAAFVPAGTEPLACVSCRARKLRCDRTTPACSRCVKVSTECVYPESRRKPTFKRRNVKELEARLAQVEDYLKEVNNKSTEEKSDDGSPVQPTQPDIQFPNVDFSSSLPQTGNSSSENSHLPFLDPDFTEQPDSTTPPFNTQLMGLGMTEALPPEQVMEDLNTGFFQSQYHMMPIIHPGRYLQAFYGSPLRKPPMCLQYAIWALAAIGHAKYDQYHEVFYRRARQYIEADEMKAWLDRLDGEPLGMPPPLGPPLTWAELEERRRVFWGAFTTDAHCCISTGWPSLIQLEDVATRLPSSEKAFISDCREEAPFMDEAFQGAQYSGFAGTVVTCQTFKVILRHVHVSKPTDGCSDVMNGSFWARHRELDNTLSSLFMFLPEKFRLPENVQDATATHLNLNLHASVMCLHHAAVEKAEKYNLPDHVKQNSINRLRAAAEEVVSILRLNCRATLYFRSPLCALSLYCTTTVYVYLAKQNPTTGLSAIDLSNLELLVQSMEAISRTHIITRAFLQQACLDIENNDLHLSIRMPDMKRFRATFRPGKSHIPLLARNAITKHTESSALFTAHMRSIEAEKAAVSCINKEKREMELRRPGKDCFKAVLGAVTRNVAPTSHPDPTTHKRKRFSSSPAPEIMGNPRARFVSSLGSCEPGACEPQLGPGFSGPGIWPDPGASSFSPRIASDIISLPDRTGSSSTSSPANQDSGARTISLSSHTSPDVIGLGNTAEENRIDLRAFQDRISTPIWQSTEETLFAQITESIAPNGFPNDGIDPWGILNADINWDAEGMPTAEL
ncbi:hypothetical protein FZEAL_9575 [Fusarium zealandicum]|uniref:Zn(2)-C6 fungal-type domain-containing protein n=1 Tax=Fusarium zealandicum TaxID=1053134 RepID=A0A8H4U9X2_9HYPO|nr:hypothetical protein FZEAL_9575 [Fusarium zealandicum]